jgi:preprotein translocase subunit SecY
MKKKKNLLLHVLKSNKRIFEQQQALVNRYQLLSEKQEKQEKLNKITRYLALGFIIVRILIFCFNNFL